MTLALLSLCCLALGPGLTWDTGLSQPLTCFNVTSLLKDFILRGYSVCKGFISSSSLSLLMFIHV